MHLKTNSVDYGAGFSFWRNEAMEILTGFESARIHFDSEEELRAAMPIVDQFRKDNLDIHVMVLPRDIQIGRLLDSEDWDKVEELARNLGWKQ